MVSKFHQAALEVLNEKFRLTTIGGVAVQVSYFHPVGSTGDVRLTGFLTAEEYEAWRQAALADEAGMQRWLTQAAEAVGAAAGADWPMRIQWSWSMWCPPARRATPPLSCPPCRTDAGW